MLVVRDLADDFFLIELDVIAHGFVSAVALHNTREGAVLPELISGLREAALAFEVRIHFHLVVNL